MNPSFIELTIGNHQILHGFDHHNNEILEKVQVANPQKKLINVQRILSLSERFILTTYGFDRLIYWEYEEDYETVKKLLGM